MSNPKELNKKKQEFLRLNGISVKVDADWFTKNYKKYFPAFLQFK